MIEREFVIGDVVSWVATLKVDGAALNLSGYVVYLKMSDVDPGGVDLDKNSTDDTDWLTVTDAAAGQITVTLEDRPSEVPTSGATYIVGRSAVSGSTRHRFDPEKWTFTVPQEGLYGAI